MLSKAVDDIVNRIYDASKTGLVPSSMYAELRSVILKEAALVSDPGQAASLRLIADILPIYRQWLEIEQSKGLDVINALDATSNAMATLSFNLLASVSRPGTLVSNCAQFNMRLSRAVLLAANLLEMEPTSEKPN